MTNSGSTVDWNLFLESGFVAAVDLGAYAVVAVEVEGLAEDMEFEAAAEALAVGERDMELAVVGSSLLLVVVGRTTICVAVLCMGFGMALKPAAVEDGILVVFAEACIRPSAKPGLYSNPPCLLQLSLVLVPLEYLGTCCSFASQLVNTDWNSNTH